MWCPPCCRPPPRPCPPTAPFDGRPLLPHLADGTPAHNALYWRSGYSLALRHGQWKLITDLLGGSTALYDLSTDPHERNDLHAQLPDTVQLLLQHHRAWQADMQPPSWPRIMDFRYRDGEREFWFPL
jgi:arylsulfatase A-like enzyme